MIKISVPVDIDIAELSWGLGRREAFELIKQIEEAQADAGFTGELIKYFISELKNEGCDEDDIDWEGIKELIG